MDIQSIINSLADLGSAAIILVVVFLFLRYLREKNDRTEKMVDIMVKRGDERHEKIIQGQEKVIQVLQRIIDKI